MWKVLYVKAQFRKILDECKAKKYIGVKYIVMNEFIVCHK